MIRTAFVAGISLAFWTLLAGCAGEPEYPNCRGDAVCQRNGRHAYCVRGRCQQCRTSADCSGAQTCRDNRCEDAPIARADANSCRDDSQCGPGQHCSGGHCTQSTGDVNARAENGGVCSFATVQFGFDDALLDEASRRGLQQTAECLERERTTRYVLVGRADPRGTTEYNLALGQRRAEAVKNYLVALGIDATRLGVTSEGSEGATGTDESGWARDRRVDPAHREAASTSTSDGARGSRQ
jgi:peptidoglycan-associated lipoprotein